MSAFNYLQENYKSKVRVLLASPIGEVGRGP